ncbi:MAG: hypothetical protein GMKNLPBB_01617 [Myxococcota bacterium]|nr:hypothetical protein [Myxococcota bacterium]
MGFRELIGQDEALGVLRRTLDSGRLAHAWLFAGPPGVGRKTAANGLAATLLCERQVWDGCGECRSCRRRMNGNHTDLETIRPRGVNIRIEQIREELIPSAQRGPLEAPYKVFIIENAEALRTESANALLKTLEEPPASCVFILAAPGPRSVLPTIVSRCRTLRFTPVPSNLIAAWLEDKHGAAPGTAERLARYCAGRPAEALELLKHPERLDIRAPANRWELMTQAEGWTSKREDALENIRVLRAQLHQELVQPSGAADRAAMAEAISRLYAAERAVLGNVRPRVTLESALLPALKQ